MNISRLGVLRYGLALILMLACGVAAAESARTLTATVPADALQAVELDVNVGEVRIEPSTDNAVHVTVKVKANEHGFWFIHWRDGDSEEVVHGAAIRHTIDGGRLALSLIVPNRDDDDDWDISTTWHVQMPARLALETSVDVGELRIDGLTGGVAADVNVGELNISVPRGSIRATVDVGEIEASTGATGYRTLVMGVDFGDVSVEGLDVPAGDDDIGSSLSLHGSGEYDYELQADIGDVELTFGRRD
ncbi:MAG TPA: hypothetical protein VFK45_01600 [Gammaproteobacteria bacterium]|nr:hypothetical protein [Gammaproteobacteria bacterium]